MLAEHRAFVREHPCPATGRTSGACPGYVVDHVRPLVSDRQRARRPQGSVAARLRLLYVLRTGVAWEDLPARFGRPNSVQRRFRRWAREGILGRAVSRRRPDRKRHLVVDTQGLLLKAKVLPADLHDRPAAELVLVLGDHAPLVDRERMAVLTDN